MLPASGYRELTDSPPLRRASHGLPGVPFRLLEAGVQRLRASELWDVAWVPFPDGKPEAWGAGRSKRFALRRRAGNQTVTALSIFSPEFLKFLSLAHKFLRERTLLPRPGMTTVCTHTTCTHARQALSDPTAVYTSHEYTAVTVSKPHPTRQPGGTPRPRVARRAQAGHAQNKPD